MLAEALNSIRNALAPEFAGGEFDIGNIANPPANAPPVLLSLVNLKEESALKNSAYSRVNSNTLKTEYFNPYVYMNAYLMFSSRRTSYSGAIADIAKVIRFLQGQNVFEASYDGVDYKTTVNIYSPTFEDLNHIWGILGGKIYPSVMYIMRVSELKSNKVTEGGGVIEAIENKFSVIQPKA
ncbi:DUF4255 domain-containing protein [Chitinophaga alhagiae]|uniref:DUF4255 domain-containing protein n=1 Tax=Chitinophaga alhagiae TaxID=2203219 RepID=UPI000E5A8DCA|nr:DUF4255 domain-containing protein [Chitinophaga alhagiae]